MRLLLDTCTFLWLALDNPQLSDIAKAHFRDSASEIFLSAVSAWEIFVKYELRRLPLPQPSQELVPAYRKQLRVDSLPLSEEMVLQVSRLPHYHRDPFDRMLICQAIAAEMAILTPDHDIRQYPVPTIW